MLELLVGADGLAAVQFGVGDAGPEYVDPVERRLCLDLFGLAVGEDGVGDLDLEVLLDSVALQRGPDLKADLIGAGKRAALHTRGDLRKAALGRGQQLLALARPVGGDERVAAHDQPLARIVLSGDLGQVVLIKQRQLQRPVLDQLADLRCLQRRDPARMLLAQQLEVGVGHHPPIGDDHHPLKSEPSLELLDLRGKRLVVVQFAREHLDRDRPARLVA